MSKKDYFIRAYMYMFGETKNKAEEVYKNADDDYVVEIIKCYKSELQKSFYED